MSCLLSTFAKAANNADDNLLTLQKHNKELEMHLLELQNANNALSLELDHVKALAADPLKVSEENKRLVAQYEATKRENNTLVAENQDLKDQVKQNTFINGSIAVILGMLATLMIQHLIRSKKRYSDWA